MDLNFEAGSRLAFYTAGGSGNVSLTGYLLNDDSECEEIGEEGEDVIVTRSGKRKGFDTRESNANSENKKQKLEEEDEDSEDPDFMPDRWGNVPKFLDAGFDESSEDLEESETSDEEMELVPSKKDGLGSMNKNSNKNLKIVNLKKGKSAESPEVAQKDVKTSPQKEMTVTQQKKISPSLNAKSANGKLDDESTNDENEEDEEGEDSEEEDSEEENDSPKPSSEHKKQNVMNSQKLNIFQQSKTPANTPKGRPKESEKKKDMNKSLTESKVTPVKQVRMGGVLVEDLLIGDGAVAKNGKRVSVYYEGRLKSTNKVFDSCLKGKPFQFRLGASEVIKGWDVGVTDMKVGSKRRLTCPPQMAYGKRGAPPDIPSGATLVFTVELKAVN